MNSQAQFRKFAMLELTVYVMIAALLWLRHPAGYSFIPPCPTAALFGLYCPGCGSTRATHFLLRGDWIAAWRHNPALILIGIPTLFFRIMSVMRQAFGQQALPCKVSARLIYALAGTLLLYMIARNLPWPAFDCLRPPHANTGTSL